MSTSLPPGVTLEHVRRYLENRKIEFGTLGAEVAARNSTGIREIAHRIKGNAALYAMPELGLSAGDLVDALDLGDWGKISACAEALIAQLAEERYRFEVA